MFRRAIYGVLIFIAGGSLAWAQNLPAPSTWVNQRNSVLSITSVDSDMKIHGNYINNATGTECIGTPFDVSGKINRNSVRFAVNFTGCDTVTVWRGRIIGPNW